MQPKIKIYSTTTCPYCIVAKNFFKANKIEFEEINIEENEYAQKEMEEISKQRSVPVIVIDGKVIVGFDKDKISEILNIE